MTRRAAPLWVGYVARDPAAGTPHERPDSFAVDAPQGTGIDGDAYRGSGYDRGHLAPNYLISRAYGREAQRASFRMSNIVPQLPRHNQLLWQRLEEIEAEIETKLVRFLRPNRFPSRVIQPKLPTPESLPVDRMRAVGCHSSLELYNFLD